MSATGQADDAVRRGRADRPGRSDRTAASTGLDEPESDLGLRSGTRPQAANGDGPLAWWLLVGGLVGLVAAGTLLVEKIRLLSDSTYVPSCSLNPVLSCGSVMQTEQAEVLGFPNPVIGVAAFPMLVVTGAAVLAGARLARWYWLGLQGGVTAGAAFVAWLFFQSVYRIGALCPYCMVVWVVVVPTWVAVTARNLRHGALSRSHHAVRAGRALTAWQAPLLLGVLVLAMLLIGERFWSYWSTLL